VLRCELCMCVRVYVCTCVCLCVRLYVCTCVCVIVRVSVISKSIACVQS